MPEHPNRWDWTRAILSKDGPRGPTARLTLIGVARHMDRKGSGAWPTLERLVEVTGLGRSTIKRDLVDAESAGWITRLARGRSYEYTSRIPAKGPGDSPIDTPRKGQEIAQSNSQQGQDIAHSEPLGIGLPPGSELPRSPIKGHHVALQGSSTVEEVTEPSLRSGLEDPEVALMKLAAKEGQKHPGWKDEKTNGQEILKWFIDLKGRDIPRGDIGFQAAAAKRLAQNHTRGDIIRALIGMGGTFPHTNGDAWDLGRLEKRFTEAHGNFAQHPAVQRWKFRQELERLDHGAPG